jgi:phage baseplate assembly protein W
MTDPELHGRGLGYPVRLDNQRLMQSVGRRKIEESMLVILGTMWGERVMRPSFGCNLGSLAFAPNNSTTANLARYYVQDGLSRWEPRVEVVDVEVTNDHRHGALVIDITYRLRATGAVHGLVVPFFLEPTS